MKKVLYLMGIDWYWIKQRPQILALELEKDYEVTVVYLSEIFQKPELRKDNDEVKDSRSVPAIPFRDKSKLACWIEKICFKTRIKNIHEYDMIWLAYPALYKYVDKSYQGKIIYDCMDDHVALCNDKRISKELHKVEKELISRADVIFATSQVLKGKVENNGGQGKTFLIRNGFQSKKIYEPRGAEKKPHYKVGYYGTIAEWMDFSLIESSLREHLEIEYHFIGPVNQVQIPEHERIIIEGVVEHDQLYEKTKDYDCYIMPFKINDTIKAVDPVKLYEYISMGKCVVSVWYEEIERFSPFIYFYRNESELNILLAELCNNGFRPKYIGEQQQEFLLNSTWGIRYKEIRKAINNLI